MRTFTPRLRHHVKQKQSNLIAGYMKTFKGFICSALNGWHLCWETFAVMPPFGHFELYLARSMPTRPSCNWWRCAARTSNFGKKGLGKSSQATYSLFGPDVGVLWLWWVQVGDSKLHTRQSQGTCKLCCVRVRSNRLQPCCAVVFCWFARAFGFRQVLLQATMSASRT